MSTLKFSSESFVLYQMLPNIKKVSFLYDTFNGDARSVATEYFKSHFGDVLNSNKNTTMSMMTFITRSGDKVNVIFEGNRMHINCGELKSIHQLVLSILMEGNIIYQDKSFTKTPENADRFFMRYYRVYIKVNRGNELYPISHN